MYVYISYGSQHQATQIGMKILPHRYIKMIYQMESVKTQVDYLSLKKIIVSGTLFSLFIYPVLEL